MEGTSETLAPEGKTDLGFLHIIQRFKIVGRRPTITRGGVGRHNLIQMFQLYHGIGQMMVIR
jgi:hypothetical protein